MSQLRVGPLVRAVSSESVAIWCEWVDACEVELQVMPARDAQEQEAKQHILSTRSRSVNVGGRHYTLLRLSGLQAATWYTYTVASVTDPVSESVTEQSTKRVGKDQSLIQCFRTLDLPGESSPLRLAYGSCRNLSSPGPDALSAFGSWLHDTFDERELLWPRLLLLIGDQIYADERMKWRKKIAARLPGKPSENSLPPGAHTFEEFASLYQDAWTEDAGVRQVLAALPTWMIFDDHEIINNWNIASLWLGRALRRGLEQTLVDGLVAYWVYQGWGNLCAQGPNEHPLFAVMQRAEHSGKDVLEDLRAWMRKTVYGEVAVDWHYEIPTVPPIFVTDVRAGRTSFPGKTEAAALDAPTRIMSQQQMEELRQWLQNHDDTTVLLVSSVPVLLPPVIGLAEYTMGVRPFQHGPLRQPGHLLAGFQRELAIGLSFDHWPVYASTWRELVALLAVRQRDIVVLSGDVHFSYAAQSRATLLPSKKHATLYQLVASPFRNRLSNRQRNLILDQSPVKRLFYGGLYSAIVPLLHPWGKKHIPHDLLMQNTVALVTLWPQSSDENAGSYRLQQIYLGVVDGKMKEIARSAFENRE